jgi:hypothetical protein
LRRWRRMRWVFAGIVRQKKKGAHVPPICDLISITNQRSSAISTPSRSQLASRYVVRAWTHWSKISLNSKVWVLITDCENPMVEKLQAIRKSSDVVLERQYTRFQSGPLNDPTSNHKFELRFGWVEGSFPYLFFN